MIHAWTCHMHCALLLLWLTPPRLLWRLLIGLIIAMVLMMGAITGMTYGKHCPPSLRSKTIYTLYHHAVLC
jgi:hypothetical protein